MATTPETPESETPPPTPNAGAEASRRDRELAALGDYVRLLADRMGLPHLTFETEAGEPARVDLSFVYASKGGPWRFRVAARNSFFESTPEIRRETVVRELIWRHLDGVAVMFDHLSAPEYQRYVDAARRGVVAIAAAWAPCLPLPLVGLMRRADEVARS